MSKEAPFLPTNCLDSSQSFSRQQRETEDESLQNQPCTKKATERHELPRGRLEAPASEGKSHLGSANAYVHPGGSNDLASLEAGGVTTLRGYLLNASGKKHPEGRVNPRPRTGVCEERTCPLNAPGQGNNNTA